MSRPWRLATGVAAVVGVLAGCAPRAVPPAAPAAAAPSGLTRELWTDQPFAQRLPRTAADLVVHYGGENHGSLEPCGCPKRPRGALAAFVGYAEAAVRAAPSPSVRVHAGYWLEDAVDYAGVPRPHVEVQDLWAMRGLAAANFDALNVTDHDVAGLVRVPADPTLPLVSAHITGPGVRRFVVVERGGLRVGITGVSGEAPSMADTSAFPRAPIDAAIPVLAELVTRTDVVILLAWKANDAVRELVDAVPGVDVVIDAGLYADAQRPVLRHDTAWTFSTWQLVRAGELRLHLDGGRVLGGVDRQVDLDDAVPVDATVARIAAEARREIDRAQRALYGE